MTRDTLSRNAVYALTPRGINTADLMRQHYSVSVACRFGQRADDYRWPWQLPFTLDFVAPQRFSSEIILRTDLVCPMEPSATPSE
jgi:hypothetical protein